MTRFDARSRKRCQYWGAGGGRRAAGGGDLLFFAESEREVRSAQAETATKGSARAEALVKSACPQGAAVPGPARDPGE